MVWKGYLFLLLLCLCAIGCDLGTPVYEDYEFPAEFVRVTPASGEIPVNGIITVIFDNPPADLKVIFDNPPADLNVNTDFVSAGKTVTIWGPFIPGHLVLTVIWAEGTQELTYTVTPLDRCGLSDTFVIGGTVKHGDKDVDPEVINAEGKIEIEFNENVWGHVRFQTEAGKDVGWIGFIFTNKAILEFVKGNELKNETTYVIRWKVRNAAGSATDASITFVTRGKE